MYLDLDICTRKQDQKYLENIFAVYQLSELLNNQMFMITEKTTQILLIMFIWSQFTLDPIY